MLQLLIAALVGLYVGVLAMLWVQWLAHRKAPILPPDGSNHRLYINWTEG